MQDMKEIDVIVADHRSGETKITKNNKKRLCDAADLSLLSFHREDS